MSWKGRIWMELSIEQIQKMENELLFHIIRLCDEHGIMYYMWVGSALATVKYKNNIPWDDDIDIAVPNNQMSQFMGAMQELPEDYVIMCYEQGDKLIHPLICVKGYDAVKVHVDIFPLYGISSNLSVQERIAHRSYLLKVLFAQKSESEIGKKTISKIIKRILLAGISYKGLYRKFTTLLTQTAYEDAEYIIFPNGAYGVLNVFSKEVLGQGCIMEYAERKVRIPEKYDEYLTQLFGEYREDPPQWV